MIAMTTAYSPRIRAIFANHEALPKTAHVYAIREKLTGRAYVGSSTQTAARRRVKHLSMLRLGEHPNRALQEAWNEQGEDAFEFVVLEEVTDWDRLTAEAAHITPGSFNLNRPRRESRR